MGGLGASAVKSLILKYIGGSPVFQNTVNHTIGGLNVVTKAGSPLSALKATVSGLQSVMNQAKSLINNPLGAVMGEAQSLMGGMTSQLSGLVGSGVLSSGQLSSITGALGTLQSTYSQYGSVVGALTGSANIDSLISSSGISNLTGLSDLTDLEGRFQTLTGSSFDMTSVLSPITGGNAVTSDINSLLSGAVTNLTNGTITPEAFASQITSHTSTIQGLIDSHVSGITDLISKVNIGEGTQQNIEAIANMGSSQLMTALNQAGAIDHTVLNAITTAAT